MSMLAPHLDGVLLTGGAGNQGDGLKMAWAHGAAIADIDALVPTFGALQEPTLSEPNTILLAYYRGGIVTNAAGHRFVDESKSYKSIGKASMEQGGARGFQIFDQRVMDLSVRSPKTLDFQRAFDLGRERTRAVKGKGVSVRVDLGGRRIIKKKNSEKKK